MRFHGIPPNIESVFALQDRVLGIFRNVSMCLTAGTALSRFYFRHRFSSDLDFVVFGPGRFDDAADFALALLRHDFPVGGVDVRVRERGLLTVFVREKETALKIDIMAREPIPEPVPPRSEGGILVDHPENIFVDKICALADRALAKDVVDLFFLVREGGLDIRAGIGRARRRRPHVHPTSFIKPLTSRDIWYILLA